MSVAGVALMVGCNTVGPAAVQSGRTAYNEAISTTNHQQIFDVIVNFRYQEPSNLLAVSAVNANFRVSGNVGVNVGVGPDSSFAGNLVPLSAGTSYEENPTITYTPVQGIDYLHELLGPIPLDLALLTIQSSPNAGAAAIVLIKSINGVRNPAYRAKEGETADWTCRVRVPLLVIMYRVAKEIRDGITT
ncbi:MAG: hypothetical protein AAFY02_08670, partial [Pseudomonadota bacterium]